MDSVGPADVPEPRLNTPACVYRFGSLQLFQPAVPVMLLGAPARMNFAPPGQAFGKPIEITSRLRDAASKYDIEPNGLTLEPKRR